MLGQDSGQPWFLYWLLNAIEVCNTQHIQISDDIKKRCCAYLRACHNPKEGGFSGAPHLQSHLASTYSAVMAIVCLATPEAYSIIDVPKMKQYLLSIKNNLHTDFEQVHSSNQWVLKHRVSGEEHKWAGAHEYVATLPGAVAIHYNGEMDMRGSYCALVVADILGLIEGNHEFTQGMGDFIASC